MSNFDDFKLAVEGITGGKNTVFFDDMGLPSVYVLIPRMYNNELIDGDTSTAVHCAFRCDSKEYAKVGFAKFNDIVINDRAYSLPGQDPRVSIDFDTAVKVCRNKGEGFALVPNSLWAAVALWCMKNGFIPHGNNNYGSDIDHPYERGITSYKDGDHNGGRCLSGSGPATWYHDGTYAGIADLCGNVWDRISGFRVVDGEIQIIPDANAAMATCDMSASSSEWKAILQDGTLVAPGTANTLKYSASLTITTGDPGSTDPVSGGDTRDCRDGSFGNFKAAAGVTVPYLLKELGIAPLKEGDVADGDYFSIRTNGERVPMRGGGWRSGRHAGLRGLYVDDLRSNSWDDGGLRSAYYGTDLL